MINERYTIKNKLGEGRSKVFLCTDIENPSEDIAIKILSEKADVIEKENFRNEFITLRRLRHPNIVQAVNFGTVVKIEPPENGIKTRSHFFTLEYFNGKPLLDYNNIKDEDSLRKIITQICSALFYLHQSDYIYYDLKPDNILVKKVEGEPLVKLIDLGFAEKSSFERNKSNLNKYVRGTAEYIAPELLKKEKHDNRVDLYSLGIILYRFFYKKFPFDTNDELKIYKAHLEQNFDFKKSNYSKELINVIKKLVEKEPAKRFTNSLEILSDLNIPINNKLVKDWNPAKIFVNRKDVLNILDTYINDKTSSEIFSIKGFEGSGKTALSEEINFIYKNSVQIKYDKSKSGYQFLKHFLKKIIFNDFVYSNISEEAKKNIDNILQNSSKELIDKLKGIFAKITQESNFTLILDDFNSYDNFTVEMLKDILPILQVNKIKIIVMEDSDYDYVSDSFHNVREINLTPFTDVQVSELLNKSYNKFFPVEELKKIILLYADLLPGSIEGFIKDCLQLNIFKYNAEKITIDVSEKTANLLKSSHDQIYEVRLSSLTENGIEAVKILSLFELNLDEKILADLLQVDKNKISAIVEELKDKNMLHSSNIGTKLQFTSEGLKKHVYSKIEEKKEYHLTAGKILKRKSPYFDRNELARQFELGEDYDTCYEILKEEIKDAEKMSNYTYKKNILKKLISFPLTEEYKTRLKFSLSEVLLKLSDYKSALSLIEELTKKKLSEELSDESVIVKGTCLIELGENQRGQQLLKSILNSINDETKKNKLLVSVAYSNFDLNKYDEAKKICQEIINRKNSTAEEIGKSYNLLGMIEIYQKNNITNALEKFNNALDYFKKENLRRYTAGTELNIGNVYNMKGDSDKAFYYYNEAVNTNISIGDLIQEAYCILNIGAYYFSKSDFEKAIIQYNRSLDILSNLGNISAQGIVLYNLGEVYLNNGEYQKSLESLEKSKNIFDKIQNAEEKLETLFLLGKFHFTVGDTEKLTIILNECINIEKKRNLGIKYKNFISYIKQLKYLTQDKKNFNIEELKKIAKIFFDLEDVNNFSRTCFLIAENLITHNRNNEASLIINSKNLINKCESNSFLEAERLYLLGKLSDNTKPEGKESSIDLYKKAYTLIKDENIKELTWKILVELAEYYSKRGNYTKAKDYIIYAKSVILYFAEKINDVALKKTYLNEDIRKRALEGLETLELQGIK